jgi:hypothetical protein
MKPTVFLTMVVFLCIGCKNWPQPGESVPVTPKLPDFAKQCNEVKLASSLNNVDPTMVLGAIVEIKDGTVHSFDSVLKNDARTERRSVSEVVFKNFVENSAVADAEWLSFLSAHVNDSTRAEVTITEVANVCMSVSSVDMQKLREFTRTIQQEERPKYGVVIGFRDFVISASLFKCQGMDATTSGYGAKIGGKWFGKYENCSTGHRIIAIYSPLPFVVLSSSLSEFVPQAPADL